MASVLNVTPDYMTKALTDRLVSDIRADLKGRIMPQVEAEVDAAIDGVLAALAPSIRSAVFDHPDRMVRSVMVEVETRHIKAAE